MIRKVGNGHFFIESVAFKGRFLRLAAPANWNKIPNAQGIGTVNCQMAPGSWCQFDIRPSSNAGLASKGCFVIRGDAAPHLFLRLGGQSLIKTSAAGGGVVNAQKYEGAYERFKIRILK